MIYQALWAQYLGHSNARTDMIMANGRILSPRALSKIRNGEQGATYAAHQLLDAGAPVRL